MNRVRRLPGSSRNARRNRERRYLYRQKIALKQRVRTVEEQVHRLKEEKKTWEAQRQTG